MNYKVKKNETLVSIAKDHDFRSMSSLIQANKKNWPLLSRHPYTLIEGMTIIIPDKVAKKVSQFTGTQATYIIKKLPKQYLNLKIGDPYGEINSVQDDVQLIINGATVPVVDNTDYNIPSIEFISISTKNPIPDEKISTAVLKLKLTSPGSGKINEKEIELEVGGLDPIIDPKSSDISSETDSKETKIAIQKILANLGYYKGDLDGDLEKAESSMAITKFQSNYMTLNDPEIAIGKPDKNTCIALNIQYGMSSAPVNPIKYDKK